jgi:hypothetical protein
MGCHDAGPMTERSGVDLIGEWRKVMNGLVSSVTAGSGGDLARQLLEPMQRQLELVQEVIERERRLQRQLAKVVAAPFDAIFDLLEESGDMMMRQADALDAAAHALGETAGLMKAQAEIFDRTIGLLREPAELAKSAAGLERRPRRRRSSAAPKKTK